MNNNQNQKKQDNPVEIAIENYLRNRAVTDEQFAVSLAKENKSLEECFRYVAGEMYKRAISCGRGKATYATDEEVYGLAVHYFDEDDIEIQELPIGSTAKSCEISPQDAPNEQLCKPASETRVECRKTAKNANIGVMSLFSEEDFV